MERLIIEHLTKQYEDRLILKDISFTIAPGECLVIAGRCGSGKSLLLRLLAGLEKVNAGRIIQDDHILAPKDLQRKHGLLMQDVYFQVLGQTVWEEISLGSRMAGDSPAKTEALVYEALTQFDLHTQKGHSPATLSGGELRKLAIAALSIHDRSIFLLDEPFANLDFPSITIMLKMIKELLAAGKSLIIATHELEKIIALTDRLLIIEDGAIAEDASSATWSELDWHRYHLKNPFAPAWLWD